MKSFPDDGFKTKIFLLLFALCSYQIIFVSGTQAGQSEKSMYLSVDDFTWKETLDDGSRAVKESGPIFGIGFSYSREFSNHVTLKPLAELFSGVVDYDGQACDSTKIDPKTGKPPLCVPAKSKVDYLGLKLQGEMGARFRPVETFFIEPFTGLGLRTWYRFINNGTSSDGAITQGYTEQWITLHGRFGLRTGVNLSDKQEWFAEGGIKLPLYNQNTAYQSHIGGSDVTVNPGKKSSLFAEAGMRFRRYTGSLFYDSLRFSKSNEVGTGTVQIGNVTYNIVSLQPRSSMDMYGVKLGIIF